MESNKQFEEIESIDVKTQPISLVVQNQRNVDLSKFTPEQIASFKQKTAMIKSDDSQSILNFGLDVQNKLSSTSNTFLGKVRAFDAGEIGGTITDLLTEINYIEIDPSQQPMWKRFLMNIPGLKNVVMNTKKMFQKYDSVSGNIDAIVDKLDDARKSIDRDNNHLQKLFEDNVQHIHQMDELLVVGNLKYQELEQEIAHMEANPTEYEDYEITDKKEFLNRLDKRLHDMAITRIVTIQSLPQIRLVQNNNYTMMEKIQASVVTTIPIWRQQIAIAVALTRQKNILEVQNKLQETTNTILRKNSELLRQNSIDVAKQNERGVVDIETLRITQSNLIQTINDIQRIKDEGVAARKTAAKELTELEKNLSETVLALDKTMKLNK